MNRSSRLREWSVCGGDIDGLALAILAQAVRDAVCRAIPDRDARDWISSQSCANLCYAATGDDMMAFLNRLAGEYDLRGQELNARRVRALRRYIASRQMIVQEGS